MIPGVIAQARGTPSTPLTYKFATTSPGVGVELWSVPGWDYFGKTDQPVGPYAPILLSPDGRSVYTSNSAADQLCRYNLDDLSAPATVTAERSTMNSLVQDVVVLSTGGDEVYAIMDDPEVGYLSTRIMAFDSQTLVRTKVISYPVGWLPTRALAIGGTLVASVGENGSDGVRIFILDKDSGAVLHSIDETGQDRVQSIVISPDGSLIFITRIGMEVISTGTWTRRAVPTGLIEDGTGNDYMAISSNGKYLGVLTPSQNRVEILDLLRWEVHGVLAGMKIIGTPPAFSPDGGVFAWPSWDFTEGKAVEFYDTSTMLPLAGSPNISGGVVLSIAFTMSAEEPIPIPVPPPFPTPTSGKITIPLTYDEQDGNGNVTLERTGLAPWITDGGFVGDGYSARYKLSGNDVPDFLKSQNGSVTMHASVRAIRARSNRDVVLSIGEDTSAANPKLELCIVNDTQIINSGVPNLAVRTYSGTTRTTRLLRGNWTYGFRFPELLFEGNLARPQACVFISDTQLLISCHYNDVLSRVMIVDVNTKNVIGQFDFPSPYLHIASAAIRPSNGTLWFGDYATGRLLQVDLASSLDTGVAQVQINYSFSAVTGFGAIEWVNIDGTEYLLVGEYATTGTRYLYVVLGSSILDGGSFTIASRYRRYVLGTINRNQGVCFHEGKLYVASNRVTSSGIATGDITRWDIETAIRSQADGAVLTYEKKWNAPSQYAEDLSFSPVTGEVWTSSEGYSAVADQKGWLAYWHTKLGDVDDAFTPENHVSVRYEGGHVSIKINNQEFDDFDSENGAIPETISIGGLPTASPGTSSGFFVGTVRNIVIQEEAFTGDDYEDAISGAYELKKLTKYNFSITNPGAEDGVTGWVNEIGGIAVRTANPPPHNGLGYFSGGSSPQSIASQTLPLELQTGLTGAELDLFSDQQKIWTRLDWWQVNYDPSDPAGMGLRFRDGEGSELAVSYAALLTVTTGAPQGQNNWILRGWPMVPVQGSRDVEVLIRSDRTSGTNNDGYFDDISMVAYVQEGVDK